MRGDPSLREAVTAWEQRLYPLVEAVPPVTPPKRVVAPHRAASGGSGRPITVVGASGFLEAVWDHCRCMGVAVGHLPGLPGLGAPADGTLRGRAQQSTGPTTIWVLTAGSLEEPVQVSVLQPQPLPETQAFELWLLPGEGKPPRSLGLLPDRGSGRLTLPQDVRTALSRGAALAVSLEPAGGSPTGQPRGPVLYQGQWARLG